VTEQTVRHFAVIKDGKVVGSRSTDRVYPWGVVHLGAAGWFATFHQHLEHAVYSAHTYFGGKGEVVSTFETPKRLQVGEVFTGGELRQVEVVH
jgi:hypothetical protein